MGPAVQSDAVGGGGIPMIVMIEAFMRRVWRVFSPDEWMARLLNLPKTKGAFESQGLVMVQIDGLGFTQFQRAMRNGNMPFLARLAKKESYELRRHYTGLPSNTPAVQGRLFYGVKACVPAFSYLDRKSGKVFNLFNPENAAAVEERIKDRGEPLLKGGSSYGNIFTGGADKAHFCAASIGWGGLLKAANPFGVPLTLLLNVHILVRALFLMLMELVLSVVDLVRGVVSGKNIVHEMGFIPLRVMVCVLLREVVAAGARIDITRGVPVVHINLAGFDEQAHHRGPASLFAHWSLRGIDTVIAGVWKAAQNSQQRHYDVFVYSDHGQEETVSYQDECGRTVEEAIDQVLEDKKASAKWELEFSRHSPYWRAALLRNRPAGQLRTAEVPAKEAPLRAVVAAMGPVGYIYLPEPVPLEEKEKIASQLVASAGIPIVMIPSGEGRASAWNSKGKFVLPEEADKVLPSDHPFYKEVTRDLVELCHHPDAGDLAILGWRTGAKSLTFYTAQGSHAGPGPEETSGFALLPKGALPRSSDPTVRTQDLREAAFRVQGRSSGAACDVSSGSAPEAGRAGPAPRSSAAAPAVLRVMTYNVHGCMGRDGKISPVRIARIIARHDPDIIALQELSTDEHAHQAAIIAQKLSMTFHYHPCLSVRKGHRGNAIFCKYPMKLVRNGSLPKLPRSPFLEPRGALWAQVDVNGLKVQVINTHLSLSPAEGLLQAKALCGPDWTGSPDCRGPVILCGDLNALSGSKICRHLGLTLKNTHHDAKHRRHLKTLPSFFPLGLVDHIFTGPGIRMTGAEVPRTELEKIASDHLPLIVDISIADVQDGGVSLDGRLGDFPDTAGSAKTL